MSPFRFERLLDDPRVRRLGARVVHGLWHAATRVGGLASEDRRARRFRRFGAGSFVAFPPGAVYNEAWIELGAATLVGPGVSLSAGMPHEPLDRRSPAMVVIGDRCNIGRGSSIAGRLRVEIGDDVTTGPNVYVTDHNHRYSDVEMPIALQWPQASPVRIGAGSWLGANVVVLPGAVIGRHVVVAAGSVVRGVVPDFCVVAGAPARVVRRWSPDGGWDPPIIDDGDLPPEAWLRAVEGRSG